MNLGLEINIWIVDSTFLVFWSSSKISEIETLKSVGKKFGVEKNFGGGEKFRELKRNRGWNFGGRKKFRGSLIFFVCGEKFLRGISTFFVGGQKIFGGSSIFSVQRLKNFGVV